ncbi:alpha-ketoglutaric semialdehyde dehydrogenase [Variibacter gotjawalensis]|uniref:Alpha-ketoglutaric semialdehyde dehydrogenase n=1 Tax=Variibacter gotjawalensis TaxID=1333996 RepID=A0A0S3PWC0_9BRAD|nr:NAD-dependent succinate-semialdehyde dehydrogenase [Variibacter gotjawalensis]NIK46030.1 succinate-semialdehyde dehydrogenase/glutarate-semialdehyde dehydrogenase [Variibacter gotjawalensis]RZS47948.1 succinate-semialdehyde dehydrogenase/glutarate-semialdehyde dehydrogenase [Variibacter gotjawalensis]BAT60204.1 alpha-ketoglutaric semialdehyde dehydrogenase [Variibacter gotjawalensis]
MYPNTDLFIDGAWGASQSGRTLAVLNPATGEEVGKVAHADTKDLDRALKAAQKGFQVWSKVPAFERYKIMRKAADYMRANADRIAQIMTIEQGKPVAESKMETLAAGDLIDWFAEEGRRTYGVTIPARVDGVQQLVFKEPVGPVAAFTPWNFPINQAVRKISCAVATGCSIILKGPEETPASCAELVKAFAEAGVPEGVVNLVYGVPSEVSEYLIPHPIIRKVTFTGSTAVGKLLAGLAGKHMKRITMELGGHAPAIVFDDADIDTAVKILAANKFRNAGQVCVAPTRFLIQEKVYDQFVEKFTNTTKAIKVGDGLDKGNTMGALAHARRVDAVEGFVNDAIDKGSKLQTGGKRIGNKGFFYEPTVLTDVPLEARIMNEEPFGPIAAMRPFATFDEVVSEANRLDYGLAAYAYTSSAKTAEALGAKIESGMVSINHHGIALPEVPFGGVKDSGMGSEGGYNALEAYLNFKFVTQASL